MKIDDCLFEPCGYSMNAISCQVRKYTYAFHSIVWHKQFNQSKLKSLKVANNTEKPE